MQQRAGVGTTVVIKGELTAHEDVVIAGRVEGLISVTGHRVVVEAGAHVAGDITAAGIVVAGTVEGSLVAEERIQVQAGADLEGDSLGAARDRRRWRARERPCRNRGGVSPAEAEGCVLRKRALARTRVTASGPSTRGWCQRRSCGRTSPRRPGRELSTHTSSHES